jgi:hypothetical protein
MVILLRRVFIPVVENKENYLPIYLPCVHDMGYLCHCAENSGVEPGRMARTTTAV